MPKKKLDGLEKGYWRTARGELLRVGRMDTSHLEASQRWLRCVLANCRRKKDAFLDGMEEPVFGDGFDLRREEATFLRMLFHESILENKLAELAAEIKRRGSFLYKATHRKRSEPRAILVSDRQVQIHFGSPQRSIE